MLKGCCTALITPFKKNKQIDYTLYKKQINYQISNGISGILTCGTTGEAPALSEEELYRVIKTAVKQVKGKVYVIAGTGTNNTEKTIERTKYATRLGIDYALIITPYYNKPNQRGLYEHFKKVAKNVKTNIIIYNVPSRTGVNIAPDTVAELSKIKNIVGIKEASGSLNMASEISMKAKKGFTIMSGEDSITLPLLSIGAKGVISTISNIVPNYMQSLFELFYSHEIEESIKIHKTLYPLSRVLFIETNPVPLKYAMKILKRDSGVLRLPLAELKDEYKKTVRETIKSLN